MPTKLRAAESRVDTEQMVMVTPSRGYNNWFAVDALETMPRRDSSPVEVFGL